MTSLSYPLQHPDSTPQQTIRSLEHDIYHLHESITLLCDLVHDQQPAIDGIEDSIHHSKEQSQSAQQDLRHAEEYASSLRVLTTIPYLIGAGVAGLFYLLWT